MMASGWPARVSIVTGISLAVSWPLFSVIYGAATWEAGATWINWAIGTAMGTVSMEAVFAWIEHRTMVKETE